MIEINFEKLLQSYEECKKAQSPPEVWQSRLEDKLHSLLDELKDGTFSFGTPTFKIIYKNKPREIVASSYRDKIVERFLYDNLKEPIKKVLIEDTFSSIDERGTDKAIDRTVRGMRRESRNFTTPLFALKCDIHRYFLSINRELLLEKIHTLLLSSFKDNEEIDFLFRLITLMIDRDYKEDYKITGKKSDWDDLPSSSSLLSSPPGFGIETGNVCSQLFGNLYLNDFDHFVKEKMKIRYYFRYADDFIILSNDRDKLKNIYLSIKWYLKNNLFLSLSEEKSKIIDIKRENGVVFLGVRMKYFFCDIGPRSWNNLLSLIEEENALILDHEPSRDEKEKFQQRINSSFGNLSKYNTFKKRKIAFSKLSPSWFSFFDVDPFYTKVTFKDENEGKTRNAKRKKLNKKKQEWWKKKNYF